MMLRLGWSWIWNLEVVQNKMIGFHPIESLMSDQKLTTIGFRPIFFEIIGISGALSATTAISVGQIPIILSVMFIFKGNGWTFSNDNRSVRDNAI
jgi:hypothetical protein